MQLPAAQTSLEPRPHRRARDGPRAVRGPEQPPPGATAADSRASPSPLSDPRITHPRAPGNDLNKLPNQRKWRSRLMRRALRAECPALARVPHPLVPEEQLPTSMASRSRLMRGVGQRRYIEPEKRKVGDSNPPPTTRISALTWVNLPLARDMAVYSDVCTLLTVMLAVATER